MDVTVIIPSVRTDYLEKILQALKDQSYPCEVIVIHDTQKNGASWARNQGIEQARGDIIIFLDDDNIPPSEWVENYVCAFKETKADILGGNYIETDPFLSFLRKYFSTSNNAQRAGIGGNLAIRRSFIDKVKRRDGTFFNEYLKYGSEDWELMARVQSLKPKSLFLDNPNYHQKKTTFSKYVALQFSRGKTVRLLKSFLQKYSESSQESILWRSKTSDHIRKKYLRTLNPFLFPRLDYYCIYWIGIVSFSLGYLLSNSAPRISLVIPKGYQVFHESKNSSFGGAEVQLTLLGKYMANLHEVTIIAADYGQQKKEVYGKIIILKSFNFKDTILVKIYKLYKSLCSSRGTHYIQRALSEISFFCAVYCFIFRKKFVYMVAHDGETDGNHRFYKSIIGRFMIRTTFALANKIIVQNEYEKDKLKKFHPLILKKGVLDIQESKKKNFDVMWVARADDWKQPYKYLELAKSLPSYTFGMVVRKATDKKEAFEQLLKDIEKVPNIKIHINPSVHQTNLLTSQAKVFCLTSTQEGDWPMTVLQSLSSSVPIVSLFLNHGSLFKEGCGYYAKGNMKLLKKYTLQLLTDEKKRKDMSKNARNYVLKYHNISTQTNALLRYIL